MNDRPFFSFRLSQALRGKVTTRAIVLEIVRRARLIPARKSERANLARLNQEPARLTEEFAAMSPAELLAHFRSRESPRFFPGFNEGTRTASLQRETFPDQTGKLITEAQRIANGHCWPLLGFGDKCFGTGEIEWNLDPLSRIDWPLTYHADIDLIRDDGSDARVVWELNRLAHLVTLGRAYAVTGDEKLTTEFFRQVASWRAQNPVARGVNWSCAMEVALRGMNLLAGFTLFLRSRQMNEDRLFELLMILNQHGAHIRRNLEYSHLATSNHYLCDVAGLLWLGVMLPELEDARAWREFGLRELLNEMDKQVLSDGADYEASTGYHRFKVELFLYLFVLCHVNRIDIDQKYWQKLHAMIDYVCAYLRPCGRAPLIGDSDGGQVLPITHRSGDDHAYVSALGAAVFQESGFKLGIDPPQELLWILGERGLKDYAALPVAETQDSRAFPEAGTYVLRKDDLYLLFNASDSGVGGRGSHGHNDALSLEVSVGGTAFIVDPGTFVYTANLHERHLFRSTAYHSTIEVDGAEQNSIDEKSPFVIGDEAHPKVLRWETGPECDLIAAEHYGYTRLPEPLIHCRMVEFDKRARWWKVTDALQGQGAHTFRFNFIFAPEIETSLRADGMLEACDKMKSARLLLTLLDRDERPEFVPRWISRDYGGRSATLAASWSMKGSAPLVVRWALVPVAADDDEASRLELIEHLRRKASHSEIRFGVLTGFTAGHVETLL